MHKPAPSVGQRLPRGIGRDNCCGPKNMNHFSIFSLARNALSYHEGRQKQWRSPEPKREYDALIVGGGGLAVNVIEC